jgi:short-subunit dehydrogenase
MQVVSPLFKQQRSGAIINISSMAGIVTVPYMSAYGATKHALSCISRGARLELAPYGVHVNTICPGYVQTDFNTRAVWGAESLRVAGSGKRGVTATQVADAVWRGYRGNRREVVVPWSGNLLIGVYRLFPKVFNWGMLKMLRKMDRKEKN